MWYTVRLFIFNPAGFTINVWARSMNEMRRKARCIAKSYQAVRWEYVGRCEDAQ